MQIAILFLILVIASIPQCVNAGGRHHRPDPPPVPQQEEPPVVNNYTTEVTNISHVYNVRGVAAALATDHNLDWTIEGDFQWSASVSTYNYQQIGHKTGYSFAIGKRAGPVLISGAISGEDGEGISGGRVNASGRF